MQFDFTLHYCDEAEAARAAFPGDPPRRPGPRRPLLALFSWAIAFALVGVLYLLVSNSPAQCPAAVPLDGTEAVGASATEPPDPLDNPVFAAGALVAFLGATVYVVVAAYVVGRQYAARPFHDKPATALLTGSGLTVRTDAREFSVTWPGVVAVAETKSLFVLKTVGDLRLVLPKRALLDRFGDDHGRLDSLRQALATHVTPLASAVPS